MMSHVKSSFGPLSAEDFAKAVAAPAGHAEKIIRKYDPMWGRKAGEKIKWRVRAEREVLEEGSLIVEAANEKEAMDAARTKAWHEWSVDYACDPDDFDLVDAEPIG
jgi:hypothetical protein